MKVKFGVAYEMYGYQTFDVPDDIDPADADAIAEYLLDSADHIPLPENAEYVFGSFEIDTEYLQVLD